MLAWFLPTCLTTSRAVGCCFEFCLNLSAGMSGEPLVGALDLVVLGI